jgi:hypothetical protein
MIIYFTWFYYAILCIFHCNFNKLNVVSDNTLYCIAGKWLLESRDLPIIDNSPRTMSYDMYISNLQLSLWNHVSEYKSGEKMMICLTYCERLILCLLL